MQLHSYRFGYRAICLILDVWELLVDRADCEQSMRSLIPHPCKQIRLHKFRGIVQNFENRQAVPNIQMKHTVVKHVKI